MVEYRADMNPFVDEGAEVTELLATVLEIMDALPSKQQMVLRLKHIDCMEVEEIASVAQMSVDAVYQNLSRARRNILQKFQNR